MVHASFWIHRAGRRGVSSPRLRSLGRSPSLRSFAPLSRGSPPRARFGKPLRGHPTPPCRRLATARAVAARSASPRPSLGRRECPCTNNLSRRMFRLKDHAPAKTLVGRRVRVLVAASQNERVEETRDRAERGSVVRGSDQASVAAKQDPRPTDRRCSLTTKARTFVDRRLAGGDSRA